MMPGFPIAALSGFFGHGFAGSLRAQWASLGDYLDTPMLRQQAADAVFAALAEGILRDPPVEAFALQDAAQSHAWMQAKAQGGKAILLTG